MMICDASCCYELLLTLCIVTSCYLRYVLLRDVTSMCIIFFVCRQFLSDNYASVDFNCWMDIESFKRIPHAEDTRRDQKAKDIKIKYLNKKYFFGPNSPAGKAAQEKVSMKKNTLKKGVHCELYLNT